MILGENGINLIILTKVCYIDDFFVELAYFLHIFRNTRLRCFSNCGIRKKDSCKPIYNWFKNSRFESYDRMEIDGKMPEKPYKRTDVLLQESLKRLAVIYEVSKKIARELDMDVLVRETLSLLRKYLDVDGMAAFFVDEDNQELVLRFALGLPQELITILARKTGEGVNGRTVLTGRPHLVRLAGISNSNAWKVALKHGFTDIESYPLVASSKIVGTMAIANKNDRPILKKDQELLMVICSQLGTVLQNAQLSRVVNNELAERKRVEDALEQSEERYRSLVEKQADKRKPVHYTDNNYGVFSEKTRQVIERAKKYATNRSIPVLICGETGTGKEEIARIIHGSDHPSIHTKRPFVAINCAAITTSLFESELFGYEPGAFTGGLKKGQIGKIQLAAGGTLFFDEIGEMPLAMQAKLLRVIQEKEFYRVGGLKEVKMDVRVICATNINLLHAVAEGRFRKDLYYRLKVGYLYLLPLRERAEEMMPLAIMFLKYFAQKNGKKCNALSESAAKMLSVYDWPGNIRELRNAMEWAAFMYDGVTLELEHLDIIRAGDPFEMPGDCQKSRGSEAILASGNLKNHTDQLVKQTLESHGGNKAAAARELGISRRSLYRILEKADEKNIQD